MESPIKYHGKKLSFYNQNGEIPLTIECKDTNSQTIADALFIHRETKMGEIATVIRAYTNWYASNAELLEKDFEQVPFGLWIFLRERSKERYQHDLVSEFFIIGHKVCCQMTVQDDTDESLDAIFEIRTKQGQPRPQLFLLRQIRKFPEGDLVQRNQCRSDCVDRVSQILKIEEGMGEYITIVQSFYKVFCKLEDFLERNVSRTLRQLVD